MGGSLFLVIRQRTNGWKINRAIAEGLHCGVHALAGASRPSRRSADKQEGRSNNKRTHFPAPCFLTSRHSEKQIADPSTRALNFLDVSRASGPFFFACRERGFSQRPCAD